MRNRTLNFLTGKQGEHLVSAIQHLADAVLILAEELRGLGRRVSELEQQR